MRTHNRFDLLRSEHGASLVETAIVAPLLLLLLLGAVDFGRAYYLALEVGGAAHAGAEYGVQNPTDTAGMNTAALDDAPNVPNLTVNTPIYGCECSDGTQYSTDCSAKPTNCSYNVVYRVTVSVSGTYSPLIPWPHIPSSLNLTGTATMRSGNS